MVVVTICYKPGINVDYYLSHHVPASERVMVPLGLERAEVRQFGPGPDGSPPPYAIMTSLYFPDVQTFQASVQNPAGEELLADLPNFYFEEPVMLVAEVIQDLDYKNGDKK